MAKNTAEKPEDIKVEDEATVGESTESTTNEEAITEDCTNCEGSGLADKKTMGSMAQVLCTNCKGSGKV